MAVKRCCDNPIFAGPAPNPPKNPDTRAVCGNCGADHGAMSVDKAIKLFAESARQGDEQ